MSDDPHFDFAVRYHVECELYDRKVCTGPMGRDGIMWADHREFRLINKNAHAVKKMLRDVVERAGLDPLRFAKLISNNAVICEAQRQLKELS